MTKLQTENLVRVLRSNPGLRTAELCTRLGGINKSTLTRGLKLLDDELVIRGGSRRTAYALRRPIRGISEPIPLYQIDESGRATQIALLDCTQPSGSALLFQEPFPWPLAEEMKDGWFGGLPYPLVDMRPQGFLGRNFAKHHAASLQVSENPDDWSDDDVTYVLAQLGSDLPGNLILGEAAFNRHLESATRNGQHPLTEEQIESTYPALAASAMAHGEAGSSAGGEFPKFTASRWLDGHAVNVIVKFSGADDSAAVQRWADLLICEHLALKAVAAQLAIPAAQSQLCRHAGRTFLEMVRFDRHGDLGRSAVCSLQSLNAALLGTAAAPWNKLAAQLQKSGLIDDDTARNMRTLWWFGRLIGNTDMHDGNLAFRPATRFLNLAPIYDMLPMLYAPSRGGEVPPRTLSFQLPLPAEHDDWIRAATAASSYWLTCSQDSRISPDFRRLSERNCAGLKATENLVRSK